MCASRHPKRDLIAQTVHSWFHEPYEGMGYRAEKRRWGTYWSHGNVYALDVPTDQVSTFLEDVRAYYGDRDVHIHVDNRELDASLGPALLDAGCAPDSPHFFLAHVHSTHMDAAHVCTAHTCTAHMDVAHVYGTHTGTAHTGTIPTPPTVPGLHVEPVDDSSVRAFAIAKLRAFSDDDRLPDKTTIMSETALRQGELTGSARGVIACIDGECAGSMWWYDEPEAIWIVLLSVRAPFRQRGIARQLLCRRLDDAQKQSKPILISVTADNVYAQRLYRRLGFTDEVYWRRRYSLSRPLWFSRQIPENTLL